MSSTVLFRRLAGQYDAWYDQPAGRVLFASELACLRPLLAGLGPPQLEVGAGSGRFAAALGIDVGLDPAAAPLALARARRVRVVRGAGERLPFRDGAFGAVLVVFTLCFADDPAVLLAEVCRVLRDRGALILGVIPADSPWGRYYQQRARDGDPFYAAAHLLTRAHVLSLLERSSLRVQATRSSLYQPPGKDAVAEPARDGDGLAAGFVCWRAVPDTPTPVSGKCRSGPPRG